MTLAVRFIKNAGLVLSKPLSIILVLVYLAQVSFTIYVLRDRHQQDIIIREQSQKIADLEERLKIFKIIEDFQVGFKPDEVGKLTSVIYSESKKYGYTPLLLLALVKTESSFRQKIESDQGAKGLLQLRPFVAYDVAKRNQLPVQGDDPLFDSEFNIKVGSLYLFELILKFQDVKKALIAYNQGEGSLRQKIKYGHGMPRFFYQRFVENYKLLKRKYDGIKLEQA